MNMKNDDLYLQVMDADDIYVEEVTDHTIIVDSKRPIDGVTICPMIGGGYSIIITVKDE
jgi:hypothetical protein